jgi:hypothetical protein
MLKKVLIFSLGVIFIINAFITHFVKGEGTYGNIGTADAANAGVDGLNFSQGGVLTIDKYEKFIILTQNLQGDHHFAWSNDNGSTWTQGSQTYQFLERGSVAYDSINDKLHVIWAAQSISDGIIYRRYGITRDASNNITAITREDSANINLQLDYSSSAYGLTSVVGIWVNDGSTNGSLIAIWAKNGPGFSEIRGSMRRLSLSASDGVAANWRAIDGVADTFPSDPPQVAADRIFNANNGAAFASAIIKGGNGPYAKDLYVFVAESSSSNSRIVAYKASYNNGNLDWSGGWSGIGVVGQINNGSGGYSLKYQLISAPVLDTRNDRLYVGWARWKDNIYGDTWSIGYLDSSNNPSSTIDVYSAMGTHSFAPTGDIAYDSATGTLYISYIESTTNGDNGSIDYRTYDGTNLSAPIRFYTSPGGSGGANGSADIPVLYKNNYNGRLLFTFRVNGALPPTTQNPHQIYFGYVILPTPTPTPTQTPTPTPTQTPSSSSTSSSSGNSTSSTSSTKSCGDGTIQSDEQCDGSNLNNQTCKSRGFAGGTLSCNSNCTFNTSGCTLVDNSQAIKKEGEKEKNKGNLTQKSNPASTKRSTSLKSKLPFVTTIKEVIVNFITFIFRIAIDIFRFFYR